MTASPTDLQEVIATITARVAQLDKIKSGLELALRRADGELAGLVNGTPETAPSPARRNARMPRANGVAAAMAAEDLPQLTPTGADGIG